jgi:predicted nucleic acid-binding Zn ribbon protein
MKRMPDEELSEEPGAASETSLPETVATYLRLRGLAPSARKVRRRRRRGDDEDNQPFTAGRDPRGLGNVLADLTRESGWDGRLSEEDVVRRWAEVAGADTAQHATPVGLADGTLTVQCDSTAWAKQLQFMRTQILTRIALDHPDAGITALRFVGPDVPSWKWGPRAVPGRGPRDTYG